MCSEQRFNTVFVAQEASFVFKFKNYFRLVRCRLAAKWGVRNRGDASSVSRTGAPHQIQRAKRTLTVAESGARRNRTRNNIKHNVGRIHTYLEVLVLIDLVPLIVAKVPVSLEKFMMSNVVPSVGVKVVDQLEVQGAAQLCRTAYVELVVQCFCCRPSNIDRENACRGLLVGSCDS
jgi:hypothetical protein